MDEIRRTELQCKALGNFRRLLILWNLQKHRGMTAGALAAVAHVRIQAVSQHLRVLKNAHIVIDRRTGRYVLYTLAPNLSGVVRAALKQL